MITRRTWLGALILGLLTAGCATKSGPPNPSLAQVLQSLPSVGTGAEFTRRYGDPFSRTRLDAPLSAQQRDTWKDLDVIAPPDLIDALPIGTQILLYYFEYVNSAINPTRGMLHVVIDENDRIVGWTYGKNLLGYEANSPLDAKVNAMGRPH
ncbi:MAG: hypothetical protein ABUS48_01180 [Pseudomonadota bacterium]